MASPKNDDTVTFIATVAHEVNRAYCAAIGDSSQLSWADAPEWQRASAKNGVVFHLNGTHGPGESHAHWLAQKLAEGWRYGPVKDPMKREHPCCAPYKELPKEQQIKDALFIGVVNALADLVV